MILEIGVVAACFSPTGGMCGTVGPAYYNYNVELKNNVEQIKKQMEHNLNYKVVRYSIPLLGAAVNREANIALTRNMSFVVKARDNTFVGVIFNF